MQKLNWAVACLPMPIVFTFRPMIVSKNYLCNNDFLSKSEVIPDRMLLGGRRNENGLFEWVDGTLVRDS